MPLASPQSQKHLPAMPSHSTPYVAQRRITRSRDGCLTCRIRRKKCDEPADQTVCGTCQRLRIECLGYATRPPEWLTPETRENIMKAIAFFRAGHGREDNLRPLSLARFYERFGWAPTLAPFITEQHTAIVQPWEISLPSASPSRDQDISNAHFSSGHVPPHTEMSTGTMGGPFPPHHLIQSSAIFFLPPGSDGTELEAMHEDLFSDEAWPPFDHSDHSDHSWGQ